MEKKPSIYYVLASEQFPVQELVEHGALCEKAGFDGVWTSDHFQPWQANEGHSAAAWVTLSALSQRTSNIVMGTGVTCPSFRYRPPIVAQVWASLSLLAPNRMFLGLGAGEKLNEAAAGGGWAEYEERAARLEESVKIIRELWKGQEVDIDGQFWHVDGKLYDPPSSDIPIYVAAGGEKSAKLAGRIGDGLILGANDLKKEDSKIKKSWEEGARSANKDPHKLPILAEHWAVVGGEKEAKQAATKWRFNPKAWTKGYFDNVDPSDIQRHAEQEVPLEKSYESWTVSEEPSAHGKAFEQLVEFGATHIVVHVATPNQREVIDFFGKKVIPTIR